MDQVPQVGGAILILTAFVAAQRGVMDQHARPYLLLNAIGAGVLTAVAFHERDWGFFMLEAVWTAVSMWGLVRLSRGPSEPARSPRR